MHAVIEASDSNFFHHWDKLCANDSALNPIYQQAGDSQSASEKVSAFTDRSFLVMAAEEPVFGCSLTMHLDEQGRKCIGYFGREASSHVNQSTMQTQTNNFRPEAIRLLQEHINQLIEEIQPHTIDYLDPVSCGVMSPVTQVLLEKGAVPVVQKAQIVDLSNSQRDLYRSMTKSCRAMVEWGRRNLDLELLRGDAIDVSQGESKAYEALINKDNCFLLQARYKGELVSTCLFVHNDTTCHLVRAEKISDTLDRPVLAALIWEAIVQSKDMGCSHFDLGNAAISSANEKSPANDFSSTCFGGESHARLRVTLGR